MTYALGHRATGFAVTHTAAHVREHPRFGVVLAGAPSLLDLSPAIFDQGQTGSCEGHGWARCIAIECAASGIPLPFIPSPLYLYRNALAIERATFPTGANEPLDDSGTDSPAILRGLATYGVRAITPLADRYSDCDPATICDEPSIDEEIAGAANPMAGAYEIPIDSPNLIDLVETAIDSRIPINVEMFVDTAFMGASGSNVVIGSINASDPKGGGHDMALVAKRVLADNTVQILLANSWSTGWGDQGYAWITQDVLRGAMRLTAGAVKRPS